MFVMRGDQGKSHEEMVRNDVPLLITSMGILRNESNTPMGADRPQGRGDYQLLYISAGKGIFLLDGIETELPMGTVVLFRPGVPQLYSFPIEDRAEYYWCHFTGSDAENLLKKCRIPPEQTVFRLGTSSTHSMLFLQMIRELQLKREDYNDILELCLHHLLLLLHRNDGGNTDKEAVLGFIDCAIGHFNRNYTQDIKVMEYAQNHLVSPSWFTEHFKQTTGCSPQQYLIQVRMTNAMHLLDTTEYSVAQVAAAVGYTNTQYFHRLFHKRTGLTPTEYRHRNE